MEVEHEAKRRKVFSSNIRTSSDSFSSRTFQAPILFLNRDLQLYICSFLSVYDLRCMTSACRHFLNLLMESRFVQLILKPKHVILSKLELRDLIDSFSSRRNLFGISFRYCENIQKLEECLQLLPSTIDFVDLSYRIEANTQTLRSLPHQLAQLDISCCRAVADDTFVYLADMENLKILDISNCFQLTDTAMQNMPPNLNTLSMGGLSKITTVGLAALPKSIERLNLTGCVGIQDLSPLSSFQTLKKLKLQFLRKVNNEEIAKLPPSIEWLCLSECEVSEKGLAMMKASNLQTLDLTSCPTISTLDGLADRHPDLRDLTLAFCENISNDSLRNLPPHLRRLSLFYCSQIKDDAVEHLKELRHLRYMDLRYTEVTEEKIRPMKKDVAWIRLETSATEGANGTSSVSTPESSAHSSPSINEPQPSPHHNGRPSPHGTPQGPPQPPPSRHPQHHGQQHAPPHPSQHHGQQHAPPGSHHPSGSSHRPSHAPPPHGGHQHHQGQSAPHAGHPSSRGSHHSGSHHSNHPHQSHHGSSSHPNGYSHSHNAAPRHSGQQRPPSTSPPLPPSSAPPNYHGHPPSHQK